MSNLDFSRSKALRNIPDKKVALILSEIENSSDPYDVKTLKTTIYNRYAESNIPIEYWSLKMGNDFKGDQRLLTKYNELVADIKTLYMNGSSVCFAGFHGVGKTFTTTSILKKASQKGYSCLYTTLSDIVSTLMNGSSEDKFLSKKELSMVDFLVIDEVDIRFFNQSESSNEIFGKMFELILRTRQQNKLPTFIATNSPNIKENFKSFFKDSLGSLFNKVQIFTVFGEDYRAQV